MDKQIIITLNREYGSGGHDIAEALADRLGLPYYDRDVIEELAKKHNFDSQNIRDYDESPRKHFLSRSVKGHSNSPEEIIAEMQFNLIKEMADEGKSFIIVGRCAEYILKDYDCMLSFFVSAEHEFKVKRTMETRNMTRKEAESTMKRHDTNRKLYHRQNTGTHWGHRKNYDMMIDSSVLGLDKTTDIIESFIRAKFEI